LFPHGLAVVFFRLEHGAGLAGGVIVSHGPHLEVVFLNDLWRGLGALVI
jgi:hypothetical protein